MVNSGDGEDFKLGQAGIIYQDQIVVMQNKNYRNRRLPQPVVGTKVQASVTQERIVRPNIKGLLRTHHNSDLDELQRSGQKPEVINLASVMMSADNHQLDRRIDLRELKMQQPIDMYGGQGEKQEPLATGAMRYSEEYVRNSLLK